MSMRLGRWLIIFLLFAKCGKEWKGEFDKYGGLMGYEGSNSSGFFRVEKRGDRWWFVTPENHLFISFGVNSVNFNGDFVPSLGYSIFRNNLLARFGGEDFSLWRKEVKKRFEVLNFNTLGSWSDDGINVFADLIPYTINLSFAQRAVQKGIPVVNKGWWTGFPDVFEESFEEVCNEIARESIIESSIPPYPYPETDGVEGFRGGSRVEDPYLIGYFLDNELNWFGDASFWEMKGRNLVDDFIKLPPGSAGKRFWVEEFLKKTKGYTLENLNERYGMKFNSWDEVLNLHELPNDLSYPARKEEKGEFLAIIADRFFRITTEAIRRYDPNHLILCARFASDVTDEVLRSASRYCDAISVNDYYTQPNLISDSLFGEPETRWNRFYRITFEETGGRPFILSEFGVRAWDSGNPNTHGAGWWVDYQEERAVYFKETVESLINFKSEGDYFVAGFHWFEWEDEPKLGRFDGENSNYGLNSIRDEPYLTLQKEIGRYVFEIYRLILSKEKEEFYPPKFHFKNENPLTLHIEGKGDGYEVILSPFRSFEGGGGVILLTGGGEISFPLSGGNWWITVRGNHKGVWSSFAKPLSVRVIERCGELNLPSGWRNYYEFSIPDTAPGIALMLPASGVSSIVEDSIIFSESPTSSVLLALFTANSLSPSNPVNGGKGTVIPLLFDFCESMLLENIKLEIYPLLNLNGRGEVHPSSHYIGIALLDESGNVLYDSGGSILSVEAMSWNQLVLPANGEVKRIMLYLDTSIPDIPLDQRIGIFIRNIQISPLP